MLTNADIDAIQKARKRLNELERRLDHSDDRDYSKGRLAEACRSADDALLQVLIIANVQDLGVSDDDLASP